MVTWLLASVCAVFLLVGVWGWRKTGAEDLNASQFMLANRRMPLWIACLTLSATWIGGGYINGTAEAVYRPDLGLVWCQAPWCYALSLILGGLFFARPMRRRGYRTMLDLFAERYGPRMAAALSVPALIGDLFWTAAILSALGTTLSVLFQTDPLITTTLAAGVVITYTFWGGLWSVALSDVVQLTCIVGGLGLAMPFILSEAGGLSAIVADYRLEFGDQARWFPDAGAWTAGDGYWAWQWLDAALLLICGGIPWQVYFQRILACRSPAVAMWMSIIAGIICLLVAMLPVVIGMAGAGLEWSQYGVTAPDNPADVLPYVLRYVVPGAVSMVGLVALIAAVTSSMDSSILSSASMITWNIYRPWAAEAEDSPRLRSVLRSAIIVFGGATVALALTVNSVYRLWFLCADLVYVILFPQLVTALFLARATRTGALAGLAVAITARGAVAILPEQAPTLPWLTLAMLSSLATILVVSLVDSRRGGGNLSGVATT